MGMYLFLMYCINLLIILYQINKLKSSISIHHGDVSCHEVLCTYQSQIKCKVKHE